MSLPLLKQTISNFTPGLMSEEDAMGLEHLLNFPAFEPLWSLVEEKLESYWEWARNHPAFVFDGNKATEKPIPVSPTRKRKVKQEAAVKVAAKAAPKPLTMSFKVINGILVPVSP